MKIERIYGTDVSPPTHLGSQTPRLVHSAIEFNHDKQRRSSPEDSRRDPDMESPHEDENAAEQSTNAPLVKDSESHINVVA
ncbi:MAG: hypothetical protein QY326_07930 [Bdellovibrionota bacterium]|nr:MAG: hypothetical protein QY326_07930 [Bdellovibrionota bacterium]